MRLQNEQEPSHITNNLSVLSPEYSSNFQSKDNSNHSQSKPLSISCLQIFTKATYSKEGEEVLCPVKVNTSSPVLFAQDKSCSKIAFTRPEFQSKKYCKGIFNQQNSQLSSRKNNNQDLNVNRRIASYLRRKRKYLKKTLIKHHGDNISSKLKNQVLISPISEFNLKTKTFTSDKPLQYIVNQPLALVVPLPQESEKVINERVEEENPETPKANLESRATLQKRNEETPYRITEVEIPEYVFNIDDEQMDYLINPAFNY